MAIADAKQQRVVAATPPLTGSEHGEQSQAARASSPDEATLTWAPAAAGPLCTQMLPETPIELWNFDSELAEPPTLLCTQGTALVLDCWQTDPMHFVPHAQASSVHQQRSQPHCAGIEACGHCPAPTCVGLVLNVLPCACHAR